jgi:FkbM family methyltransferase
MRRNYPLPAVVQSLIISNMALLLLRSNDFPSRLRLVTLLRKFGGNMKRLKVETKKGFLMALDDIDYIQKTIQQDRIWEPELTESLDQLISEDDIFYDIGANVGYFSLFCACVKKCKVLAFEPDPLNCEIIRLNSKINGVEIKTVQKAISSKQGELKFFRNSADNSGQSGFNSPNPVAEFLVDVTTIDSFIRENPELPPTVIKIDVEGHEYEVILGMLDFLNTCPPRLIVFESNPDAPQKLDLIKNKLKQCGYAIRRVETSDDLDCYNWIAEKLNNQVV